MAFADAVASRVGRACCGQPCANHGAEYRNGDDRPAGLRRASRPTVRSASILPEPASDIDADEAMRAYYRARAPTYDDWYLRRGAYAHGPIDDLAWQMELDSATLWLDALPLAGEIVELAAGTGWWSPLLAGKGELWCYDAVPETLDVARRRLVAHGLRAHLHAARCMGRAGSTGRRPLLRLLDQPRPADAPG